MARIAPFRGLRYAPSRVGNLRRVVAPPYDVISPGEQRRLHERSPFNVVRLILGTDAPGMDRYTRSARSFREWIDQGVLRPESVPSIYAYAQGFHLPWGGVRRRLGFLALCRLEDFGTGKVHPHERTFEGPKGDRLRLMRAARANFSPVFALYSDPRRALEPALERALRSPEVRLVDDDRVEHRFSALSDPAVVGRFVRAMGPRSFVIADGHHRYETALQFRDEMRAAFPHAGPEASFEYMLIYFTNLAHPGLAILPIHRLLPPGGEGEIETALSPRADLTPVRSPAALLRRVFAGGRGTFGLLTKRGASLVEVRPSPEARSALADLAPPLRGLDVSILHRVLLPLVLPRETEGSVIYLHDAEEARAEVLRGEARAAFLLKPTDVREVRRVAERGLRMPQKSTFFYPKLLTGLVLRSIDPSESVAVP